MSRIVAGVENPNELHIGTNSTASTGTVPNEGADTHRHQQTDERNDNRSDSLAAAYGGNTGVYERVNAAGGL